MKILSEQQDSFDRNLPFAPPDVNPYISKTVSFKFRGIDFSFALSHGLFSSANIDTGTRLLLKVLSKTWDNDLKQYRPPPRTVLDAGCGIGVIGICAAKALADLFSDPGISHDKAPAYKVRCQDRDALAEAFTVYNAGLNGINPDTLSAHTETMLEGTGPWDLILSNIPAKAGRSVHEDFIRRAPAMLGREGRLIVVVVNPLAGLFRKGLEESLLAEEQGREHTVLTCGPVEKAPRVFADWAAVYFRNTASFIMEETPYTLETFYGEAGFDNPDFAVQNAAKLLTRLHIDNLLREGPRWGDTFQERTLIQRQEEKTLPLKEASKNTGRVFLNILIHEPGQGHLPLWLISHLAALTGKDRNGNVNPANAKIRMVLSGRNIIALKAAQYNIEKALRNLPLSVVFFSLPPILVPAIDMGAHIAELGLSGFGGTADCSPPVEYEQTKQDDVSFSAYDLLIAFPALVPMTDRHASCWEALTRLLNPGGIAVISMSASEAQRFDRLKIKNCSRIGDLKRNGFRALAYSVGII
ncbi:MAG: methyltransferase [Treponema sp.]|jgi:hypothetical protein|nr:methyltransferase [Treponema sp.]